VNKKNALDFNYNDRTLNNMSIEGMKIISENLIESRIKRQRWPT
jgi:hypothetical protein